LDDPLDVKQSKQQSLKHKGAVKRLQGNCKGGSNGRRQEWG